MWENVLKGDLLSEIRGTCIWSHLTKAVNIVYRQQSVLAGIAYSV